MNFVECGYFLSRTCMQTFRIEEDSCEDQTLTMNRSCVVFLVVVVCATSIVYGEIIKCCESNHSFEKVNGTFKCSDNPSNNSHIFTSTTNFLENNTDGQCVEFFENFYIFNISKSVISQFKIVDKKKVYSKCCPVNFLYNTFTHGCEEAENVDNSKIKEYFIKVGLPTCDIIGDEIVENISEEFNNNNSSCIDRTTNGPFILRKCENTAEICWKTRCVRKCCHDGQIFLDNRRHPTCIEGYQGINLTVFAIRGASEFPEDPFGIAIMRKFSDRYLINESINPSYLNRKGTFSYGYNESNITSDYCLEYVRTPHRYFFVYITNPSTPTTGIIDSDSYSYSLSISIILLAITIIIYFLLNEVKKIFGKILVNYCLAVLIWNGILTYYFLSNSKNGCLVVDFVMKFGRMAVFVWSNVLCLHTWRMFGSMTRNNDAFRKKKQYKTIMLYSLYGWGIPTFLTLIIFLFFTYDDIVPYVIQPFVTCYVSIVPGNYAKLLYEDLPAILLQIINIILFVKTTIYCLKVKKEISNIDDNADKHEHFKRSKAKLYLVLKLIIIMGLTYLSEALTGVIPMTGPVLDVTDDVFNIIVSSQGIFVFIIFVCNQQIYKKMKTKLRISIAGSSTSTQSIATQSSNVSDRSSNLNISQNYTKVVKNEETNKKI